MGRKKKTMGGPYSGSSLARFVRVGAVATGITYGFVVSGVWSLVKPSPKSAKKH